MSAQTPLIRVPVTTRWGDMDALNHVNNSVYATYVEEARLRWFQTFDKPWVSGESGPVLAGMHVNFRKPILWPTELLVALYCIRVGNSSLTLGFRIVDRSDESTLYADGDSVLVWVASASGASVPLPDHVRRALELPAR
jgi:acyl-CoA thioester hydrolase